MCEDVFTIVHSVSLYHLVCLCVFVLSLLFWLFVVSLTLCVVLFLLVLCPFEALLNLSFSESVAVLHLFVSLLYSYALSLCGCSASHCCFVSLLSLFAYLWSLPTIVVNLSLFVF